MKRKEKPHLRKTDIINENVTETAHNIRNGPSRQSKVNNSTDGKDKNANHTLTNIKLQLERELAGSLPESEDYSFVSTNKLIHRESVDLVPDDIPLQYEVPMYPAEIYGDGNCLPRCGSFLAYGNENHHLEIRKRIVLEMIANKDFYLDNNILMKGKCPNGSSDVVKTFAMYSSQYTGGALTRTEIERIYVKEVLEIMRPSTWMGAWQLASLATILRRPVVSVYPSYGNSHNVRSDLHRVFYPLDSSEGNAVYIMWTHLDGATIPECDFTVNHFVVLLPMVQNDSTKEVEDNSIEFSEHEEESLCLDLSLGALMEMLASTDEEATNLEKTSTPVEPTTPMESTTPEDINPTVETTTPEVVLKKDETSPETTIFVEPTIPIETLTSMETTSPVETNPPPPPAEHTIPEVNLEDETSPEPTTLVQPTTPVEPITPLEFTIHEETFTHQETNSPVETTTPVETLTKDESCNSPEKTTPVEPTTPMETTTQEETSPVVTATAVETTTPMEPTIPSNLMKDETNFSPKPTTSVETFSHEETNSPLETTTPVETTTPEVTLTKDENCFSPETTTPVEPNTPVEPTTPVETFTHEETSPVETTAPIEPTTPVETTTPEVTLRKDETRLRTGAYVLVEHGNSLYPAVVDNWPWVRYFSHKKKGLWALNDIKHTVVDQDIRGILQSPEIVKCGGTRLLYQFKDAKF